MRLSLVPSVGDPDLFVFGPRRAACARAGSLRSSSQRGGATERISVRNRGRRTRTFYVAVGFNARKDVELFNASYVLRAR